MLDGSLFYRLTIFFACAVLFVVCDVLAANWAKNGSAPSFYALILCAPLAYISFGYLNQKYALAVVSAWVVLVVCVSSVLLGIFVFNDQLTFRHGIGIVLAIVSAVLLLL